MMKQAKKGQGVVEYAGALVVAAVIVSAAIAFAPATLSGMFETILGSIETFFNGEVTAL